MNYFIIIFFVLSCVCILSYKKYSKSKSKNEQFSDNTVQSLVTPIKCGITKPIKVRKDLTRSAKSTRLIYGRPNICFSCEREVLRKAGPKYIHYAFPSKCFSCEKESKRPYFEGPTKCFSCN